MALVQRLTNLGILQSTGSIDEYTIANPYYSVQFNGSTQWLTVPTNAAFALSTGDFTIELLYYNTSNAQATLIDFRAATGSVSPMLTKNASNVIYYFTNNSTRITGTTTLALNTWYHIALVRSNSVTNLYINGIQEGSSYSDTNTYVNTTAVYIANSFQQTAPVTGYISNLRIVKGTAVYTANFQVPFQPLTAIANTSLLVCKASTIIDSGTGNGGSPFTVTNVGTVTASNTIIPTANPASKLFNDGTFQITGTFDEYTLPTTYSGNYVYPDTAPYSVLINPNRAASVFNIKTSGGNGAILNTKSNNWTIEFWFKTSAYADGGGNSQWMFDGFNGSTFAFFLGWNNSGTSFQLYQSGQGGVISGTVTAFPLNQWNHFALVCNTTITLYINGVAQSGWNGVTNAIVSDANVTNVTQFQIGGGNFGAGASNFYFSQVRINNAVSVYTGNFTPPSRLSVTQYAGTNINAINLGTMLLTCNSSSFIDQSTNALTLTPFTNASPTPSISTTEYPPFTTDKVYNPPGGRGPATGPVRTQSASSYQVFSGLDEVSIAYTITPDKTLVNEGDTVTYTINAPLADNVYSVRFNPNAYDQECAIRTYGGNGSILNARSNNWTIEFWFKTSVYTSTGYNSHLLFDCYNGYPNLGDITKLGFLAQLSQTTFNFYDGTNNQSGALNSAYPLNQWNHLALVCNTTLSLYINGVVQSGWNAVTNNIVSNSNTTNITQFNISSYSLGIGVCDMYISQFRVNNTTSVYTGNFTPPTRLTVTQGSGTNINAITNGTMLLTCNSSAFTDQSPNAFTLLPFGSNIPQPVIANDAPSLTGSSFGAGTLYWTNSGSTAAADFTGGIVYGVTPLTWAGTATATLWSFTGITQSATSGFGTGAVFSIRKNNTITTMVTHGVLTVIPTSPGSGYTVGDTITIDGGSLGLTSGTNNLTIIVGSDWFAQGVYPSTVTGTGLGTMTAGDVNWTCPDGVYRISVVCIGGGGGGQSGANPAGGGGGGLSYLQDWPVVPGTAYRFLAGAGGGGSTGGGAGGTGGTTAFYDPAASGGIASGAYGGSGGAGTVGGSGGYLAYGPIGFAGGKGGNSVTLGGGGGGAGGYTAVGGAGGSSSSTSPTLISQSGSNSTDGGGGGSTGGGAGALNQDGTRNNSTTGNGGGGGGVALLGAVNTGLGGVLLAGTSGAILGQGGQGGSGGAVGGTATATIGGAGGYQGGGGGGGSATGGVGGAGAFRIIWNYPHGFLPSTTPLAYIGPIYANPAPFTNSYGATFNGTTADIGLVDNGYNFCLGTSDFTIEGFVYPISTSINRSIIAKRATSTSTSWISFGTSATTPGYFGLRVANATGSAWTVQDETACLMYVGTWYHFAITKTNGYVNLYINGILIKQYAHNTLVYDDNTSMLDFGRSASNNTGNNWFGQMSNIRFTPGIAIYTSNFTVPTSNLSVYGGTLKKTVALVAQSSTAVDDSGYVNGYGSLGGVTYGNSVIPFSNTYSAVFNGTTAAIYLSAGIESNFDLASNDFTIEGFVYATATTIDKSIIIKRSTYTTIAWVWFGTSTTTPGYFGLRVANATGSAWTVQDETAAAFSINTWYHFAITKTNGYVNLYINGILIKQYAHNTAIYNDTNATLDFGRSANNNSGGNWVGYMSNMRVTTGIAIYTGNFTTPTTALSPIRIGTTLLLAQSATNTENSGYYYASTGGVPQTLGGVTFSNSNVVFNSQNVLLTAQDSTFIDNSGYNGITNVGTATAGNTTIPFANTYSYQFNGTTQYLTLQNGGSSIFSFGASSDFTIEGYLYTSATTINKGLIYKRASGSAFSGVGFGTSSTTTGRFQLRVANDTGTAWTINDATAGTFVINTWYHFAITKTNGVVYLYLNGLLVRQYAHTTAIYDDGTDLTIGRDPGGSFWVGYLSNIRILNGLALYYPPSTIVKRNYPDYPYVVPNSGSIAVLAGTGTLTLPISQDVGQEGVQDIRLSLRSGSTSGTVLATAPAVLVADTSKPLALPGGNQCWCAYPDYVSGPNLVYTGTPGVFTFTAPKGYTAVSAVCIGGGGGGGIYTINAGGGGGGGALAYSTSISVTAGTTYTITCGAGGTAGGGAGGYSAFASTVVAGGGSAGGNTTGGAGGTVTAGTGFAGGAGGAGNGAYPGGGGGGAGGYTAAGGAGGAATGTYPSLTAASGVSSATGGAGGASGGSSTTGNYYSPGGGGGGTSPFGSVAVASIAGAAQGGTGSAAGRGGGGSGGVATTTAFGVQLGQNGYTASQSGSASSRQTPNGGRFGGGGGGGDINLYPYAGVGGPGCVRIIWGTGRSYPSTLTADRVSGYPAAVGNPAGQQ
jgi:hypothetical protein